MPTARCLRDSRSRPEAGGSRVQATGRHSETDARARTVAFHTLGCKLNQFETEALASEFTRAGYRVVGSDEAADCRIINTCTVTGKADRKSRNTVNRAVRSAGDDDSLVVVTGCFAAEHREELEQAGVTYVVENDRKRKVFELVDAHFRGEVMHPNQLERDLFSYQPSTNVFRTRAMLKVQDGCDNFCSFCIIPKVRGRAASRPVDAIIENLKAVIDSGYREVVLTGVNMTRYDDYGFPFSGMLERVLQTAGEFRVRISSIEPDSLDERFFSLLTHPKLCPHLHLCLQSGSERVLLQMRRQYTAAEYRRIAERIRTDNPLFNLSTDVIVGFPGETDEDFAATVALCRALEFSHIHTFPYSPRSGTRAARSHHQVPAAVKKRRAAVIRSVSEETQHRYYQRFVGCSQQVLLEQVRLGRTMVGNGYGEHYLPVLVQNDRSSEDSAQVMQPNDFVDVTITELSGRTEPVLAARPRHPSLVTT